MAQALLYGAKSIVDVYRFTNDATAANAKVLTGVSGVTAVATTFAATNPALRANMVVDTDVAYDSNGIPTITITSNDSGKAWKAFKRAFLTRAAGASSGVSYDTGYYQGGEAFGSTTSSSSQNFLLVTYSAKDTSDLNNVEVEAFIMTLDPTSDSKKAAAGKIVQPALKFIGTPLNATAGFTVPAGTFDSTLVTVATFAIPTNYYTQSVDMVGL